MSSAALIESMSAQNLTLERSSAGAITAGIFVPGAITSSTIRAGIQPAVGEDLISLPEGQRERESYKIYSVSQMKTNDEANQIKADILVFYGARYEVQNVQRHFGLGFDHWKAIVTRTNE